MEDQAEPRPSTSYSCTLGTSTCVICKGEKGPLSLSEKTLNITEKGLQTFLKSCEERQDEVAELILPLRGTSQLSQIRFHMSCRSIYTDVRKRETAKKRRLEGASSDDPKKVPKVLTRQTTSCFSWDDHCFICFKAEDKKHGNLLSKVNMRPSQVRENVLQAATERGDERVMQIMTFEKDIFAKNAKCHKLCYQTYISRRNIDAYKRQSSTNKTESIHNKAATAVFLEFKEKLEEGMIIFLPDLCKQYRDCLIQMGVDGNTAMMTRAFFIKNKIQQIHGESISFYSQKGLPDIVCSSNITVGLLLRKLQTLSESEIDKDLLESEDNGGEGTSDDQVLHNAASILRNDIEKMEVTTEYANAQELNLEYSSSFVPDSLQKMFQWLVDKDAFDSADLNYRSTNDSRRKYLTLAECLIYCCRRGKMQIIPPFHIGLMVQLQHEYGSRRLIDTLNAYGMCASYDELRAFLTAAAEDQISQAQDGVYVPPGLVPRTEGGTLIQEGDDNVDVNVETVDGKNTYHSMARVIFQEQPLDQHQPQTTRLQRSTRRTLSSNDHSFLGALAYERPKLRAQPQRIPNASQVLTEQMDKLKPFNNVKDIAWTLLRQLPRKILPVPSGVHYTHSQVIPFWTGFNTKTSTNHNVVTVARYAPSIEAPPSDMATVYTTLKKGKALAEKCGQNCQVHTFDQQLYAIAQLVKMSRPDEFQNLVLRLGGFHTMSTFIACIGEIWGDGGLKDMLSESGTYAPGTVENMMAGRQFHRATRGLTLVYEALMQVFVTNFLNWLEEEHRPNNNVEDIIIQLCDVQKAFSEDFNTVDNINAIVSGIEETIIPLFKEFREWGREKSVTFSYWDNCLTALQILMCNIRAEREGNWQLHLCTQVNMLPYFFAADRHNYSRWAPLYSIEMLTSLPQTVAEAFHDGQFSVKQTSGGFKGIWSDMGVETSVIRDSKSDSGIIGLTRRGSAVLRWTCTRHIMGKYAESMNSRSGKTQKTHDRHEQEMPAMMKRDEEHTQQIVKYIEDNMVDPFSVKSHPQLLINIGSGLVSTTQISSSLLNAVDKGTVMMSDFVTSRLTEDVGNAKSFYDPISKSGLKTFKDMKKPTKVNISGKTHKISVSPELIYQRALTLATVRPEVNLAIILSYPVTAVPPTLFKEDGSKRMTTKADLLHGLEDSVNTSVPDLPETDWDVSAHIVDAMAELQRMNMKNMKTFNDIGEVCLNNLMKLFELSEEVHFVFDRYDDAHSPKSEERIRRQGVGSTHKYHVAGGRPVPDWKTFMSLSSNKEALTTFLSVYLEENAPKQKQMISYPNYKLFLAGGYSSRLGTKCITHGHVREVVELSSTQSEADTRMLLHAMEFDSRMNAKNVTGRLVVRSPDTDVMVLLVHYMPQMQSVTEVWMETGRITRTLDLRRFIAIHDIVKKMGPVVCRTLPAVHALTGCDTVSSFFGVGKKTVLNHALKLPSTELSHLQDLGVENNIVAVKSSRSFIAGIYDSKNKYREQHMSLNMLRLRLAATRSVPVARLPPCEDVFAQHVQRASWQVKTWTTAHLAKPQVPDPVGHGWDIADGNIIPIFFKGPTALDKLKDYFCTCKASKCHDDLVCPCRKDGLACSPVCRCEGDDHCSNPNSYEDILENTSDSV